MKKQFKYTWISEKEASQKTGFKPETLRRYCRTGKLAISYTRLTNGGATFYALEDIQQQLDQNAVKN